MVYFYEMPEEDTDASREKRGKDHYVMFEPDECGAKMKSCQPELDWLKHANAALPYSEFLLFLCSGAIASAEATDIEWGTSAPTMKNTPQRSGHRSPCT